MSVLTAGPHGWLGRQFIAWREAHGYRPGLVYDPRERCTLPECRKRKPHGSYRNPLPGPGPQEGQ